MKANWWSCVLGLFCMPAEVMLSSWTVSQEPLSICQMRVNSSATITCSTSLSHPMGVYLHRGFHGNKDVVYLSLERRKVTKDTIAPEFTGRIHITPDQQIQDGNKFTFQLSLLRSEDTDWYYCSWVNFMAKKAIKETLSSNGTIIIVRETDPQEQCKSHIGDLILIALSVTAFSVVLFLFIGALIVRCRRFKKYFRPTRAATPSRPSRHQHVCPQEGVVPCPYLVTSATDFRGIL